MTPLKFLTYSAIGIVDGIVVLFLLTVLLGMLKSYFKDACRVFFTEKEKFLQRLGSSSLPYDVTSKFH